ncbi:hypothetical protein CF335_g7970 [Tilletia laevis]|nr:hypothetical protein CF335_g7970 [Tilletia laevis]
MSRFATSCRQAADVFGHSPVTIGRSFKIVIRALLDPQLYQKYISLPSRLQEVPTRIKEDPALYSFFKTVIGAIDGSHVPAHAPVHMRDRFWNRKGYTSFNVLAACDFDMKIMYILSGWEGSTSDSFLWKKALGSGLRLRGKERLLGDAGFPLSQRLLIPYRGVRYHLKEFGTGMQRPRNAKELYNRRHAGARNVVERTFGVLQARFRVLVAGCNFDIQTQADIFPALALVHNVIREHDPTEDLDAHSQGQERRDQGQQRGDQHTQTAEARRAAIYRNCISNKMWQKYRTQI